MTQLSLIYKQEEVEEHRNKIRVSIKSLQSGIDRTWCSPSEASEIVGADVGQGFMHLHFLYGQRDEALPIKKVPAKFFEFEPKTLFVIEAAHMSIPQTEKSLAQPFTESQLIEIYQTCKQREIELKLFPHGHTRKARDWVAVNFRESGVEAGKSSDENDARGLAWYVSRKNGIALANPRISFGMTDARLYGKRVIEQSNIVLNAARVIGYRGEIFQAVYAVASHVFEESQKWIHNPSGDRPREYPNFINEKVAFGIASLMVTELPIGVPRVYTFKGRHPGFNFWKNHVLRFSSFHHGGGVARSNNCWHTFRPYLVKFSLSKACEEQKAVFKRGNKYVPFSEIDESSDNVRRLAWQSIRYQMKNAYEKASEYIHDTYKGTFQPFEVLTEQTQ